MYYGIAGGAKVFIDCSTKYDDVEVEQYFSPIGSMGMKREWKLMSEFDGIRGTVRVHATSNADRRVVISCLLAGLKNIADSAIYDASVASIETTLGFQVDRWIPAGIAEQTDVLFYSETMELEYYIPYNIGSGVMPEPVFTAHHLPEKFTIQFELEVKWNGKVYKAHVDFEDELWHDNMQSCTEYAHIELFQSFYKEVPECADALSAIRYKMFENELSAPSAQSANIVMAEQIKWQHSGFHPGGWLKESQVANYKKAIGNSDTGEDSRVKELPALNELVKHPITNQILPLKRVIISLNDASGWTREQIADWLETLDIDISFKPKESNE